MKLLIKPSSKKALPVVSWNQIKKDAFDMLELLNAGKFGGLWAEGFALHHSQVSDTPFDFFVVHKQFEDVLPRVICNAHITEYSGKETFKEGCLSFPHRQVIKTVRWWNVDVVFDVPPIDGFRSLLGANRLKQEQGSFDGLIAFMFQHEIDHGKGNNVYHK